MLDTNTTTPTVLDAPAADANFNPVVPPVDMDAAAIIADAAKPAPPTVAIDGLTIFAAKADAVNAARAAMAGHPVLVKDVPEDGRCTLVVGSTDKAQIGASSVAWGLAGGAKSLARVCRATMALAYVGRRPDAWPVRVTRDPETDAPDGYVLAKLVRGTYEYEMEHNAFVASTTGYLPIVAVNAARASAIAAGIGVKGKSGEIGIPTYSTTCDAIRKWFSDHGETDNGPEIARDCMSRIKAATETTDPKALRKLAQTGTRIEKGAKTLHKLDSTGRAMANSRATMKDAKGSTSAVPDLASA